MRRLAVALGLALATVTFAAAAQPSAPDASEGPVIEEQASAASTDPEVARLKVELEREQLRALVARTRFAGETDNYQARMYRHHQFWTDTAAVAVYLITAFGLLCAAVQFRLVARMRGVDVHQDDTSAGAVELPGGAKVSSPFLGVIVLFLSLGFFYLYLTNVYPIVGVAELEAKRVGSAATSASK